MPNFGFLVRFRGLGTARNVIVVMRFFASLLRAEETEISTTHICDIHIFNSAFQYAVAFLEAADMSFCIRNVCSRILGKNVLACESV